MPLFESKCRFQIHISNLQWDVTMQKPHLLPGSIRITYHPEIRQERASLTTRCDGLEFQLTAPYLDMETRIPYILKGITNKGSTCCSMDDLSIAIPSFGSAPRIQCSQDPHYAFSLDRKCIMQIENLGRSPFPKEGVLEGWILSRYKDMLPYLVTYPLAERGLLRLENPWQRNSRTFFLSPDPEAIKNTDLKTDLTLCSLLQDSKVTSTTFCRRTYQVECRITDLSTIRKNAGPKETMDCLPIPPEVQTEDMLYMYVWSQRPQWLPDWKPPVPGPLEKDYPVFSKSIPWDNDAWAGVDITYRAVKREALCQVWVEKDGIREEHKLPAQSIPKFVTTREKLLEYVFQRNPSWNLKYEEPLMGDMNLHTESISLQNGHAGSSVDYRHSQRLVRCQTWSVHGPRQGPVTHHEDTEELPIPPEIQTVRQLKRYVREKTWWIHDYTPQDPWGVLN